MAKKARKKAAAKKVSGKLSAKSVLAEIAEKGNEAESTMAQQALMAKARLDETLGLNSKMAGSRVPASPMVVEPHGGPNIVATSIGEKRTKGKPTGEAAVIVYVEKKSKNAGPAMIPKTIGGFPTDVVEVGELRPLASSCGGMVCGPTKCGTLGCIVKVKNRNDKYILTNWHVVAFNHPFEGRPVDDGAGSQIGVLTDWVTPRSNGVGNIADVALAKVTGAAANSSHCQVRNSSWLTKEEIAQRLAQNSGNGFPVRIVGQNYQPSTGRVIRMDGDRTVNYQPYGIPGLCRFVDMLIIKPDGNAFSDDGDSGSLVVTVETQPRPVGLLFAGDGVLGYANRIGHVVKTMDIVQFHA